jgi:hypothetical protein
MMLATKLDPAATQLALPAFSASPNQFLIY